MDFVKQVGPLQFEAKTENGVASIKLGAAVSLGGGEAAGVAKAKGDFEADLTEAQCIELLKAYVEAVLPQFKVAEEAGAALLIELLAKL